jgi:phosphatidylglycerophosphate synthase
VTTLVVDAREGEPRFGPARLVCGLPLVTRHLLAAAHDGGFERAVVLTSAATHADVTRAIAARDIPRLAVEVRRGGAGDDDAAAARVDAREVMTRADLHRMAAGLAPSQPRLMVRDAASARQARLRLVAAISKSMHSDGIWCWYFMRPISRQLVRLMLRTGLRPNQVSVLAIAIGVVGSLVVALGGRWATSLLPLVLLEASMILDCCDGDIARLKFRFSRAGEWLDSMGDEIVQITLVAALGLGLWRDGGWAGWAAVGGGAAAVLVSTGLAIYGTLHRRKLPIDSAQFPWFFGTAAHADAAPTGIVGLFGWVFRRDVFLTMIGALCALDLRIAALGLMTLGAAILGITMVIHLAVTRTRSVAGSP